MHLPTRRLIGQSRGVREGKKGEGGGKSFKTVRRADSPLSGTLFSASEL